MQLAIQSAVDNVGMSPPATLGPKFWFIQSNQQKSWSQPVCGNEGWEKLTFWTNFLPNGQFSIIKPPVEVLMHSRIQGEIPWNVSPILTNLCQLSNSWPLLWGLIWRKKFRSVKRLVIVKSWQFKLQRHRFLILDLRCLHSGCLDGVQHCQPKWCIPLHSLRSKVEQTNFVKGCWTAPTQMTCLFMHSFSGQAAWHNLNETGVANTMDLDGVLKLLKLALFQEDAHRAQFVKMSSRLFRRLNLWLQDLRFYTKLKTL